MSLWTNDYLDRLALEAETEIALKTNCIIDRISFETTKYQSEFILPDYVYNVKKVYWKGERLTPITHLAASDTGYDILTWLDGAFEPQAFTPSYLLGEMQVTSSLGGGAYGGKPVEYFYSKFGENVIRLNPGVNENLNKYTNNLWSTNIKQSLIVEFYRFPDGITWKIPDYIRRRAIKSYVMWKAYQREGDGQNLKAADYHKNRYAIQLRKAIAIINGVYQAYTYSRSSSNSSYDNCDSDYGYQGPYKKARPVMPSNYGVTVEDCGCE